MIQFLFAGMFAFYPKTAKAIYCKNFFNLENKAISSPICNLIMWSQHLCSLNDPVFCMLLTKAENKIITLKNRGKMK